MEENKTKTALYKCRMCSETYVDTNFQFDVFEKSNHKEFFLYELHQCNEHETGWADFIGIRKVEV